MERVSLQKVNTYDGDLGGALERLLAPLGGGSAFFKPGDRVLLKPNFIGARTVESAATTHPALILAVARYIKDHGCAVAVGDSPGIGAAEAVVRKLGLEDELKRLDVPVIELATPVPLLERRRNISFERRFMNLQVAKELDGFDRIVNLPKLKSHGQMGLTLATKNLFGCVAGHNKGRWHFAAGKDRLVFARLLLEIALTVNPDLHILDGIVGMDGNGPSNGRPRPLHVLMAGVNPLALDRTVVELLRKRPEQFPIFEAARAMRLSGIEWSEIVLSGEPLEVLKVDDFQIPALLGTGIFVNQAFSRIAAKLLRQRLVLDQGACIKCRKCEEHCPARAIVMNDRISIDEAQCILCCCCQEFCPVGALRVSEPVTVRLLKKLKLM